MTSWDEVTQDAFVQGAEDRQFGRRKRTAQEISWAYGDSYYGLYDAYQNGWDSTQLLIAGLRA